MNNTVISYHYAAEHLFVFERHICRLREPSPIPCFAHTRLFTIRIAAHTPPSVVRHVRFNCCYRDAAFSHTPSRHDMFSTCHVNAAIIILMKRAWLFTPAMPSAAQPHHCRARHGARHYAFTPNTLHYGYANTNVRHHCPPPPHGAFHRHYAY